MQRVLLNLAGSNLVPKKAGLLLSLLMVFLTGWVNAQSSGIFESYAILSLNGGANAFYDMQATTGNPDFQGANLGIFAFGTNSLVVKGGQNKTYKNGGCDITGSAIQYRVYKTGTTPGSFTSIAEPFDSNMANPGDQIWQGTGGTTNLIASLTPGNYTLEVYSEAYYTSCGSGTHFSSNSSANYKATFTVTGSNPVFVTATGGTTIASYTTLKGAIDAVNAGTHTGVITIEINANTTETATSVLNSTGAGSASYTSLLIQPSADAVTVSGAAATGRGLIELNGADNVTINGDNPYSAGTNQNLTITNNATNTVTYASVIRLAAATTIITSANGNTIKNCIINGNATGRNASGNTSTSGSENVSYGIYAGANASTSSQTTAPTAISSTSTTLGSGATMTNLIIDNNTVNSCARGIAVQGSAATVFVGLQITKNTIGAATANAASTVYSMGITAQGSSNGIISGNTVRSVESYVTASLRGIDVGAISNNTGDQFTITNNIVYNIVQRATTSLNSYGAYGIHINGGTADVVANNFIYNINNCGSGLSFSFGAFGIRVGNGNNHKIVYNTVTLTGTNLTALGAYQSAALCLASTSTTGLDVRNNILSNTSSANGQASSVASSVFMPTGATSSMNLTLNNNAYYTGTTAGLHGVLFIGSTASTTYSSANLFTAANFNPAATTPSTNARSYTSTLSSAGTNDNAAFGSTNAAPFVSATDLHINTGNAGGTALDAKGSAVAGVTLDIDGATRNATTPDIGADEFTMPVAVTPTITSLGASSGCVGSSLVINGTDMALVTSAAIGGTPAAITGTTATTVTVTVGSGTTGTVSVTNSGGTATSAATFTVNQLPATPTTPTSNSPQCATPGVTLTRVSPPAGETWYWQTTATGTTVSPGVNDQTTYVVNTSGTYYLRSQSAAGCWSTASASIAVTVTAAVPSASVTPSPVNAATGVCYAGTGAITSVSWAATSGATSYDVFFGAGTLPVTLTSNVATNSYTTGTLAANTTYHWKVVAKNLCGDAVGSTEWTFTTSAGPCYCASNGSSSPTDGITGVTFNGMTNTGTGLSQYTDYTATKVVTVFQGATYSTTNGLSVYVNTGGNWTNTQSVYIDWNQNGLFTDSGEFYNLGTVTNQTNGISSAAPLSVTVPVGATLGTTRMRVQSKYNGATGSPCLTGFDGETEDYAVNVLAPALPTITSLGSASGCVGGSITINGTNLGGASASGVTIGGTAVTSITSNTGTVLVAVIGSGTTGTVSVTTPGGTANSAGSFTVNSLPTIGTQPAAPATICATAGVATISVSASGATTYQWRRNGAPIANGAPYSGADTATLTITNPAESVAGSFDVVVGSSFGCTVTSSAVNVAINPAPPVTTNATICQGGSGVLTGSASCQGFANAGTTISGAWNAATDPIAFRPNSSTNSTSCAFSTTITRNYVATQFQVSATGTYSFEMSNNAAIDGIAYITTGAFVPGSCAAGTLVRGDDDSATTDDEPMISGTFTAGVTYTLISTTYDTVTGTYTGPFSWTVTPPSGQQIMLMGTVPVSWYTGPTGGSPIATTNSFNPVGVAGSGLVNTNTPGITTFYAACTSNSTCRTAATFTINANVTYYADADNDTYGNPAVTQVSCTGAPAGYVANNTDCDDTNNAIHQTFPFYVDADNDTYGTGSAVAVCAVDALTPPVGYSVNNTDCDDTNGTIHQTFPFYVDADNDTYGTGSLVPVCAVNGTTPPVGYSLNNTDCNDANNEVWQTGLFYVDADGDGYTVGAQQSLCYGATTPAGYASTSNGTDCNDNNNAVYQSATLYIDADGDGYDAGTQVVCYGETVPAGYSATTNGSDCNDGNNALHETFPFYADGDHDGYGTGSLVSVCAVDAVTPPFGYSLNNSDCNDGNAAVYQSAILYVDADFDGYTSGATQVVCYGATVPAGFVAILTAIDCNDGVAAIHPNAVEIPYNGVDDDCDNLIDETGTVTTTLLSSSCGVTLASIQSLVGIQTVGGHNITGYRIRMTNGAQVQIIEKNVPHFTIPQFPSYAYATTYSIDIQLQRNGIWQASWGAACLVSTPAILEEGGAAQVSPSQCGITLPKISTLIATGSIQGVTGYRFRVTNLTDTTGPNAIQQIDRTQNWFSLQMLTRYNYGTTYRIEVAVKTTGAYGGFGAACEVSSPAAPSLVNCGGTVAAGTTTVAATSTAGATQYRFQIVRVSDGASTTIDRSQNWFIFNSVPPAAFSPGALYNVRVAVMTTGTWSPFGDICEITSPGNAAKGTPTGATAAATNDKFSVVAYPSPFTADFGIEVMTSSKENVAVKVYDMVGKLIESRELKLENLNIEKIGIQYPSGVYNVIVSQDGVVRTLRVIKR